MTRHGGLRRPRRRDAEGREAGRRQSNRKAIASSTTKQKVQQSKHTNRSNKAIATHT